MISLAARPAGRAVLPDRAGRTSAGAPGGSREPSRRQPAPAWGTAARTHDWPTETKVDWPPGAGHPAGAMER
ncbi:hypothetical protein GCM10010286_03930 [Streptomyces toxytricini]|nr:hypothetical protein GCM10010286_03930 [Streptomyces toxytricini]